MESEDIFLPFISPNNVEETDEDRNDSLIYSNFEKNFEEKEDEDFAKLIDMGFDEKMILKVKVFLHPKTLEETINLMTKEGDRYQHNFYLHRNSDKCYICGEDPEHHMDYDKNKFDPLFFFELSRRKSNGYTSKSNRNSSTPQNGEKECIICNELIPPSKFQKCILPCGHAFCEECWFEYLSEKIKENEVQKITCMKNGCKTEVGDNFILLNISSDEKLVEKYKKFKLKSEILSSSNKKFCPFPGCESYGEMVSSEKDDRNAKYVTCGNGHRFCFNCLKDWHGRKKCQDEIDKDFKLWKKGKIVKQCPNCKYYTEKTTGCNHMTCAECKYEWCWLCRGKYKSGHFDVGGPCPGLQFSSKSFFQNCFCLYSYKFLTFFGTFMAYLFFSAFIFSAVFIFIRLNELYRACGRYFSFFIGVFVMLSYGLVFQILITELVTLSVVPILLYPPLLSKIIKLLYSAAS